MLEHPQEQNPSVRKLLMRPLLVGMSLLLFLICISLYAQYATYQSRELAFHRSSALKLYEQGMAERQVTLGVLLEVLTRTPAIRAALATRDTRSLRDLHHSVFEELRTRYGISHLLFLDSQRCVITRMGSYTLANDIVERFTLREAERTRKPVGGLDIAAQGKLTVHMAAPVFSHGEVVGYIEGGMDIGPLIRSVSDAHTVDLIFFLQKDAVDRNIWASDARRPTQEDWDRFGDSLEVYSTLPEADHGLSRRLLAEKSVFGKSPDSYTEIFYGNTYYTANLLPLKDSLGNVMGDLFILENSTELRLNHALTIIGILACGILVIVVSGKLAFSKLRASDALIAGMVSRIKEGEVVFQNVFEESETGFVLQNWITGEVLQANRVALNIFGLDKAAGINFSDLRPLPQEDALQQSWQASGAGTPLMSIATGREARYCEIAQFFIGTKEEIQCIAIRDVTRVVNLQHENRMQIQQLQTILDHLPGMVTIKDSESRILLHNASFDHLFGSGASLIGKVRFADWLEENVMDNMLETDRIVLASAESRTFENTLVLRDGREYTYVITKQVLEEKDGGRHLLSVSTDISERSRMEKQLVVLRQKAEEANLAKSQFLAHMSHEIRTPMNAIIGMSHLAIKADPDPRQLNYLSKIHSAAKNLLGIINDILDFSKIEAGEMRLESIPFSLRNVIGDLRNITQPLVMDKPVRLAFHLPDIPEELMGDPLRVRQVLLNLINNAIKFTTEGEVRLSCSIQEDKGDHLILHFAVEDSGIGISEEGIHRLFTSFQQVDGSTTREYGGTGLGLAISRQLVSLMGGTISVHSVPGRGSTFFFLAPFGKVPGRAAAALAHDVSGTQNVPPKSELVRFTREAHVLVVEDNEINQEIIVELLQGFGLRVTAVGNGQEAVQAVREHAFSLVLMDLQMPVMDGITATGVIRRLPKAEGEALPIVALTANAMTEDKQMCLDAGMNDFLSKPINVDELEEKLVRWLGGEGASRSL